MFGLCNKIGLLYNNDGIPVVIIIIGITHLYHKLLLKY